MDLLVSDPQPGRPRPPNHREKVCIEPQTTKFVTVFSLGDAHSIYVFHDEMIGSMCCIRISNRG